MGADRKEIALMVLRAKAVEIRDVPKNISNDEVEGLSVSRQPFLYTSGNWGPGYVTIKNLVGRKDLFKFLTVQLALLVAGKAPNINFVSGNVTGGMVPGWILSEALGSIFGRTVPFVYVREATKKGGQKELITGIANNPEIAEKANGLVVEELVNFSKTLCNSASALRDAGYRVTHAATILFYDNPEAVRMLEEHGIEMIYLLTLPELLVVAEEQGTHSPQAINDYRDFLADPLGWQKARGLTQVEMKEGEECQSKIK